MQFNTRFNIGDTAYVWNPAAREPVLVTIGQISVMHRDSKGRGRPEEWADNYKAQQAHEESYMCEETGIGAGRSFYLSQHIFSTAEECRNTK